MSASLDDLVSKIKGLSPEARDELAIGLVAATGKWCATPGPQKAAAESLADVLLFGGSGGCGKSSLLVGLAMTEHRRALLVRRHYTDLSGLTDEAIKLNGSRKGFNGSVPPKLQTVDGRLIEFAGVANPGDEENWQGRPHDFLGIDEVTQIPQSSVRYLMGWLRSTQPGQRKRVVFASNPPLSAEGDWIIEFFAPWLDTRYPNPAKPGELRWVVTDEDGRDRWVDGPEPIEIGGRMVTPLSRTFIPGTVDDNPFLRDTGYKAQLDALPEPLRSAVRDGNFMLARQDDAMQVIPTDWIRAAQARWTPQPPPGIPMCAIGVDVARSSDETVLAPRYDGYYPNLIAVPGRETPHGTDVAGLVIKHRRHQCTVVIDVGEGNGGEAYAHLRNNEIENAVAYRGMDESTRRTADKQLAFFNKRSQVYWQFREALDPGQPNGSPIALPDDPKLVSDLTAPTWELTPRGIKVLSKQKVVEKLRRSPDRGDAVVMSWYAGARAMTHASFWDPNRQPDNYVGPASRRTPVVNMGPRRGGSDAGPRFRR